MQSRKTALATMVMNADGPVESAHDPKGLRRLRGDRGRRMDPKAERVAVELRRRTVGRNTGSDTDAEPIHSIGRIEQCGEVGQMHPDPSSLARKLRRIGARLVDGGHDRQPTQRVGCSAEADGVTDLEVEPLREATLEGETGRW